MEVFEVWSCNEKILEGVFWVRSDAEGYADELKTKLGARGLSIRSVTVDDGRKLKGKNDEDSSDQD